MGTNNNDKKGGKMKVIDIIINRKIINVVFFLMMCVSVFFLLKDGIYAKFPSERSGGFYINFLLYQIIFIVTLNLIARTHDIYTSLFFAFCCAIASHGLFEIISFSDAIVLRYFVVSESSGSSLKNLTSFDIFEKIFYNFFNLFRMAWYISALLPIYIFHEFVKPVYEEKILGWFERKYDEVVFGVLVVIMILGLVNIHLILTGDGHNFLDERFFVVLGMKSLFGSIFVYLSYWWGKK